MNQKKINEESPGLWANIRAKRARGAQAESPIPE